MSGPRLLPPAVEAPPSFSARWVDFLPRNRAFSCEHVLVCMSIASDRPGLTVEIGSRVTSAYQLVATAPPHYKNGKHQSQ
jgi:hypothetical protein